MVIHKNNQLFKTISFSQGEQFLKFQKKKIQNNSYINSGLTKVNGYDESGSYLGQASLRSMNSKSMAKNQTLIDFWRVFKHQNKKNNFGIKILILDILYHITCKNRFIRNTLSKIKTIERF